MKIDEKKLRRQEGIVQKWIKDTGAKGTLEACTGFGKTFTAILAVQRFQKKYPEELINVVVPSIALKEQWEEELKKREETLNLKVIKVYVVNTYIRYEHQCALIILDEVHRYASEEFHKVFIQTVYNFALGLTATLERNDGLHELIEELLPVFDTVSLEEARREGYVTNFKVFNYGLELNDKDKKLHEKIDSTFKNTFAYFNRDFELAMNCGKGNNTKINIGLEWITASEYRLRFAKQSGWTEEDGEDHFYHPKNVMLKAVQWRNSMHNRKKILYTADSKIEEIERLVKHFKDKKIIIFSENSEFADKVTETLGDISRSYHTKLKSEIREERIETFLKSGKVKVTYKKTKYGLTKLKREALELFRLNLIRVLVTVRMLDEGFDDEEIGVAIQASYTSSKRQDTQRTGRAVRINYQNKEKESIVINLYIKNSQEEKWLREKQKDKRGIIEVDSLQEIINYTGGLILN